MTFKNIVYYFENLKGRFMYFLNTKLYKNNNIEMSNVDQDYPYIFVGPENPDQCHYIDESRCTNECMKFRFCQKCIGNPLVQTYLHYKYGISYIQFKFD